MNADARIDPAGVDWERVVAARYRIEQTLHYEYETPISDLHHRLMIAPRMRHLDQQRLDHRVWSTAGVPLTLTTDAFGNEIASLSVAHVEREITFGLESTIVRATAAPDPGAACERAWLDVGRLTRADEAMLETAAYLRALHPNDRACARAIMRCVHERMTYTKGVTDVFTTASTAFHMRRGVCQDYAHVAIALARACGIGARYASGHLIGEGATHAWVEFLLPCDGDVAVLSLDPTYNAPTDLRYVVVAIGRDYDDVPPTSGVFTGCGGGRLDGRQNVRLIDVSYAA